ncbi:MAG: chemotaxis protein CheW [Candidatus Omnitrophota bacterium]
MTDRITETKIEKKWEDIHRKIRESADRLKKSFDLSPEERQAILVQRAQTLAQKEKLPQLKAYMELIEFRLGDECYAIESIYIREVCPSTNLTPIPGAPAFISGIISVRGEIVSIVDLRKFFEMPETGLTDQTRVIILQSSDMQFGILAEEVTGSLSFPLRDIIPPLPTLTGIRAEYLKGVTQDHLIVLDASKLLSDKKMIVCQEVVV